MGGGGGVTLCCYTISNDNPYNIYRIYTSNLTTNQIKDIQTNQSTNTDKQDIQTIESQNNINNLAIESQSTKNIHQTKETLTPKHIDYIIFLDSDDYWKLNCIEECVKHSNGVDIVWFDYEYYLDGICPHLYGTWITQMQNLELKKGKISSRDWLYTLLHREQNYFAWVVQGMTSFSFLKKINLYFLDNTYAEDHLFGTLLFLQSKDIYVTAEALYIYRIRPNSSCNFNRGKVYIPKFFEPFCDIFKTRETTREYYVCSSWLLLLLEFIKYIQNNKSKDNWVIIKIFFQHYIVSSMKILELRHDPLNLIPKMHAIEPYLRTGFKYKHKLRIENPKKYNRLKPFFIIYDSIKLIERKIRKKLKSTPPPPHCYRV